MIVQNTHGTRLDRDSAHLLVTVSVFAGCMAGVRPLIVGPLRSRWGLLVDEKVLVQGLVLCLTVAF